MKLRLEQLAITDLPETDNTISCRCCEGGGSLCCRSGTFIPLTRREHQTMQARGSVLKLLPREELPEGQKGPGIGRTYYELIGDCASLQADGSCGDYDDRPRACRKFPVGGYYCQLLNYAALMAEAALPATEADHTLEA